MQDLLSQDEIDALLHGVDDGDVETESGLGEEEVQPFDLTSQDKMIRGRMPVVDMINERFRRAFRLDLYSMLRVNTEVSYAGISVMKFDEYIHTLYIPTSMNVISCEPLKGNAILALDAKLVFKIVDNFFGGSGRNSKIESSEFTPAEDRLISRVVDYAFRQIESAWEPIHPVKLALENRELIPALVNVTSGEEIVVVSKFLVEISGSGGELHVAMPFSMLAPIKDLLGSTKKTTEAEFDKLWSLSLQKEIMDASVDFSCKLFERDVSLRSVVDLAEGDIVPVELPEHLTLRANGVPVFKTQIGSSNGNFALKILNTLQRS